MLSCVKYILGYPDLDCPAPEMIESVGRASNFAHVTRLFQVRSSHDRRQNVAFTWITARAYGLRL